MLMGEKNGKGTGVTSPLWPEQRIMYTRVFPHWTVKATWVCGGSTTKRVAGATLDQWSLFPM